MQLKKLGDINKHMLAVLYGNNGTGKTSVINTMPGNVLIIDTDNGLNSVDQLSENSAVAQCTDWNEVNEALNYHKDFDSIVIDTIDKVQELAIAFAMQKEGKVYGKDMTGIQHYGTATTYLLPLIDNLVSLAKEGKNVLVLGHEREFEETDLDDNVYKNIHIALMPKIGQQLMAQARVVGYLYKDYKTIVKNGTEKKEEVYLGLFGGNPKITTKVSRPISVKAPNVIKDVSWEKLKLLTTGKKEEAK